MIDIIVPVYNTPIVDLNRCLNSIENQTYRNYVVYIIDDGSNNETKKYLDNYAKQNNNVFVKHIKNSGVSNARNVGLDISNNDYVAFIDSDDTFTNNFLEEAYNLMLSNNLDLIIGGYNEIKDGKITKTRLSTSGLHIYEKENINNFLEKLLSSKTNDNNKEIGDCPTGRIYTRLFKRNSIGNLRFDINVKMSEDTLFMIDYTYSAKRIGIIDKIWYNYYKNDYSISNKTKNSKMIKNINVFINEIIKRYNIESNLKIREAYKARIEKANEYINRIDKK